MKNTALTRALLAAALAGSLALTACGADGASSTQPTATPDSAVTEPTATPEEVPGEEAGDAAQPAAPDEELSALVDSIYEAHPVELMMIQTTALDPADADWMKYDSGLDAELAAKVDAGVKSESMTGSQAYSLVLLRLKDAADAQTVADAMLANMDPAKWVCVMADKERVVTFDDKVLFVMTNSELTDIDAMIDALPEALGIEYTYDQSAEIKREDTMAPADVDMNAPVAVE